MRSAVQGGLESQDRPEPGRHYAWHSSYSDPGPHADLLASVPADLASVSAAAQNSIAHYRFAKVPLPASSNDDINARWLSRILQIDQDRHAKPLLEERGEADRLQGCCRDQVLLAIGILRQHNVHARSRVGFAAYFRSDRPQDHVVAEAWLEDRWVRFDPGVPGSREKLADPHDIGTGVDSPFLTAAAVWVGHRRHGKPIDDFGIRIPSADFTGARFVLTYLIMDVAHRFGDELLLWDFWGAMPLPGREIDVELGDQLAELVLRADAGDSDAESDLERIHRTDARVRPGAEVLQFCPRGGPPRQARLDQWRR